jgi:hypothetical protein
MVDATGPREEDVQAYMSAPLADTVSVKERRNHILQRYQTVRDLFLLRRLAKEEYELYGDVEYRNELLNALQKDFRVNLIERMTVVELLREIGESVVDSLLPPTRESSAKDALEEGEVVAYMNAEIPSVEQPTPEDRKAYYQKRYKEIEENYRYLKLQQDEVERFKDKAHREKTMGKLKIHYRHNFLERVTVVGALRRMGAPVADRFVPPPKA